MNNTRSKPRPAITIFCAASGAALCVATAPALAQDMAKPPAGAAAVDPNPYFIGVSQGFTSDSNVYRIPSGPSDLYSSTGLFGGFDQPISRQRIFGKAAVSVNRYQDETLLNNTSYDFSLGADLSTIENISGNLNVGISQNLSAPAATVGVPTAIRNLAQTQYANARLRWGGPSLLSVEGSLGYSKVDNSAPEYLSSDSHETTGSLGLFYRPGEFLRVGVAARFERSYTPNAFLDTTTGSYRSNTGEGRNFDLLAEYTVSDLLRTNGRLSYTRQTNTAIQGADLSGLTGNIAVSWQPTAKTSVRFDAARDAGFETSTLSRYAFVDNGTGLSLTTVSALYENNRVTDSVGLGLTYLATAKINAGANVRYSRATLISVVPTTPGVTTGDTVDVTKSASFGITYLITRAWSANCNYTHETRDVSGAVVYTYKVDAVGCATQFTWR